MIKKIAILFLIWFYMYIPCYAREFSINTSEKLNYVNMDFWKRFGDEYLYCYIEEAIKNNHDAKKASYMVEEYRQQIKYTFGRELPSLNVSADYLGVKIPKLDTIELDANAFVLPFIASYEADILLKNRDRTKSDKKNYEANKFKEKAVYIALASDVASAYVNIIQYDKMLELQNKILKNNEELLRKTKLRFDNGISSKTDLNIAEQNYLDAKNNVINLITNRRNVLFQLAILIGENPDCINDLKRSDFDDFGKNYIPPDCIASDVIFSRPEVLESEKLLEKAKINVRIARKEFLPSFNITGFWLFNTYARGNFFSWESSVASIMAGVSQDIFKGGQKVAKLRMQKMEYMQAFENYRQVDLKAVKEVNASLCMIKDDTEILETFNQKGLREYENYKLTNLRYNQGTSSQMDVISDENKVLNIKQNLVNKKTIQFIDYITLYKAAGAKL